MKQSLWLLWVAMNWDWSREIKPQSNLTRAKLLMEWKITAKENWTAKSTNREENAWKVKSEQPCEPKTSNIAGVQKHARSRLEAIRFNFFSRPVLMFHYMHQSVSTCQNETYKNWTFKINLSLQMFYKVMVSYLKVS